MASDQRDGRLLTASVRSVASNQALLEDVVMRKSIASVAGAIVATGAHAGQSTAYTPLGGTTAQGASGGIPSSPSALNVGVYPIYDRASRWSSAPPSGEAGSGDVKAGSAVYSQYGGVVGKVAYADGAVAVVRSRRSALRLPVSAFGVQRDRLFLRLSPYQFERLAAKYGAEAAR